MKGLSRWFGVTLGLTGMYIGWLMSGWWNFGWGVISLVFWITIVLSYGHIWKDQYLKKLALVWLLLSLIMWTRNNETVKFVSFLGWWWLAGTTIVLAKNKNKLNGWGEMLMTIVAGVGGFFESFIMGLSTLVGINKNRSGWWKVGVGILISIPALYFFGNLFYSADPLFSKLVNSLAKKITFEEKTITNVITTLIFFGSIFSLLRISLAKTIFPKMGNNLSTEIGVAGTLIMGLFVVFGLTQIPYLVISREALEGQGIMLSEYTRRGYGEMLFACLMGFGVVGIIETMVNNKWQKILNGGMLTAMLWIVITATRRNFLYQENFGMTEARILGFFFSLGLLLMSLVYWRKIYKKCDNGWLIRRAGLVVGVILIGLNMTNIDGLICRNPPTLGYGIDYAYLANRSPDGIEGWAKALDFAEKEVGAKTYQSYNEFNSVSYVVWGLVGSRNSLEVQREKRWHWGGSWNIASTRAVNFWKQNNERINNLKNKSDEIMRQINEAERGVK